jgi:hypothetical protein
MIIRLLYSIGSILCFFNMIILGILSIPVWLLTGYSALNWSMELNNKLDKWYEHNKRM